MGVSIHTNSGNTRCPIVSINTINLLWCYDKPWIRSHHSIDRHVCCGTCIVPRDMGKNGDERLTVVGREEFRGSDVPVFFLNTQGPVNIFFICRKQERWDRGLSAKIYVYLPRQGVFFFNRAMAVEIHGGCWTHDELLNTRWTVESHVGYWWAPYTTHLGELLVMAVERHDGLWERVYYHLHTLLLLLRAGSRTAQKQHTFSGSYKHFFLLL